MKISSKSKVMFLLMTIALVFLTLAFVGCSKNKAEKMSDIYFRSPGIAKNVYMIDASYLTPQEQILATSLQGITAQTEAAIYVKFPQESGEWLEELEIFGDRIVVEEEDVWSLVRRFSNYIKDNKYVLFDSAQTSLNMFNQSVNYAATVSGAEGYLMVDSSLKDKAESAGLGMGKDVRNATTADIFNEYKNSLNKKILVHQQPEKVQLRDYGIAAKAFHFYSDFDSDKNIKAEILEWADDNAVALGWTENELDYVSVNSMFGIQTMPADWSSNLSLFSGYERSDDGIKQSKYVQEDIVAEKDKHYVAIVMSDGDNIQWTQNGFINDRKFFGSKLRGEFKMTWGISPSLYDLAPNLMQYCYDSATAKDQFITGPGGASYVNISEYNTHALNEYAAITAGYMEKSDLKYVNFIDNWADKNAINSFAEFDNIRGGIWSVGNKYIEGNGSVYWANDKPFITARETLWRIEGDQSSNKYYGFTERVAQRINNYTKDYTKIEGYTVVVAHAWSIGIMDYIGRFVDSLDDSVELVTVGELVDMVANNVKHENKEDLNDVQPGDFDADLAAISSEQYRYKDIVNTDISDGREFLFTSPSDNGGWQLGNAGLQYDKAVYDPWGRIGKGSIKLEGSDMGDSIDPIPNAWMYNKIAVSADKAKDNYLGVYCKYGGDIGGTNLRVRAIYIENGVLSSHYLTDAFDKVNEHGYYLITGSTPVAFWFDITAFKGKEVFFSIEQDDDGNGDGEIVYIDAVYIADKPIDENAVSLEKEWLNLSDIFMDWKTEGSVKDNHKEGVCLESKLGSDDISAAILNTVVLNDDYRYLTFNMRMFIRSGEIKDVPPEVYLYVKVAGADDFILVRAIDCDTDYVTVKGDTYSSFTYDLSEFKDKEITVKIGTKRGDHAAINKIYLSKNI